MKPDPREMTSDGRDQPLIGRQLGAYRIVSLLGAGGPASVRGYVAARELWRGLAEAKPRTPW